MNNGSPTDQRAACGFSSPLGTSEAAVPAVFEKSADIPRQVMSEGPAHKVTTVPTCLDQLPLTSLWHCSYVAHFGSDSRSLRKPSRKSHRLHSRSPYHARNGSRSQNTGLLRTTCRRQASFFFIFCVQLSLSPSWVRTVSWCSNDEEQASKSISGKCSASKDRALHFPFHSVEP